MNRTYSLLSLDMPVPHIIMVVLLTPLFYPHVHPYLSVVHVSPRSTNPYSPCVLLPLQLPLPPSTAPSILFSSSALPKNKSQDGVSTEISRHPPSHPPLLSSRGRADPSTSPFLEDEGNEMVSCPPQVVNMLYGCRRSMNRMRGDEDLISTS